ncbi:MAG: B12-binding domain-containing radical SAM protein [Candidatus Nitrohelix vancouverensis]|uniref:B12-binding domain-containing radical SAM protein n=1 Tax=Candidatus Nitrohelix vancouverensis TaxID=2705534 RepID=A0A7T0BZU3_9BACT|nr:MAG: B12-binding domain-containing radical SAM protein [Candidatus Nitrohelix vancouverensis]
MKILFLVPPEILSLESSVPRALEGGKGYYPKLGLLYVAGYYMRATGNEARFIDCPPEGVDEEELLWRVKEYQPDMVAMSIMTFNLLDALRASRRIKQTLASVKVCLGGPHVNLYPKETLSQPEIDYVVFGEGETIFTRLATTLEHKGAKAEELEQINGLGWMRGDEAVVNPAETERIDLNELAFPARSLVDMGQYNHLISEGRQFFTIQATRGCPAACSFCDIRKTQFRMRSPENIVREIEELADQGVDDLFFVDDTITIDKKNLMNTLALMIQRGVKINYKISARVDTINPELLAALKRSGCYRIHYGIESATQRHLSYLQKGQTPEKIERACKWTRDAGIGFFAYMMIGIPYETKAEMMHTVEFAKRLKPDYAQFSICTPYPKTELYFQMLSEGIVEEDYWQRFAENPSPDFKIRFWNRDFSELELRDIQDECHARFYRSPTYIMKQIAKVKSWSDFTAKARMGTKILTSRLTAGN